MLMARLKHRVVFYAPFYRHDDHSHGDLDHDHGDRDVGLGDREGDDDHVVDQAIVQSGP